MREQERKIDAIPIDALTLGVACFWPEGVTQRLHAPFNDSATRERETKLLAITLRLSNTCDLTTSFALLYSLAWHIGWTSYLKLPAICSQNRCTHNRKARKALVKELPEKLQRLGIESAKAEEERALLLDRQRTIDLLEMVSKTVSYITL